MMRDDLLHLFLDALGLLVGDGTDIAAGVGDRGDDVVFAHGGSVIARLVDVDGGAANDHTYVEGEILFGKLDAKCVEDAGELIDRTEAHMHGEDSRGVAGLAGGIDAPGDGTAATDASIEDAVHARRTFEFESHIAVVGGSDHVAAGDGGGLAMRFFVAAENNGDFGLLQNAGSL